jgi:hypothetical protein
MNMLEWITFASYFITLILLFNVIAVISNKRASTYAVHPIMKFVMKMKKKMNTGQKGN